VDGLPVSPLLPPGERLLCLLSPTLPWRRRQAGGEEGNDGLRGMAAGMRGGVTTLKTARGDETTPDDVWLARDAHPTNGSGVRGICWR